MSLVLVSSTNVWVMLTTVGLSLIAYRLRYVYVSTARCLRRIEALGMLILNEPVQKSLLQKNKLFLFFPGRSALISHTNATINGLTTIRAANSKEILINEFNNLQNHNTSVSFTFKAATRAVAFWLELICVFYLATAIAIFLFVQNRKHLHFVISPQIWIEILIRLHFFLQRSAVEMLDWP